MNGFLRSLYAGGAVIGLTGTVAPLVWLTSFKDQEAPDPLVRFWAKGLLRAAGVHAAVRGLENVPAEQFILTLNHQSHFDVPLVLSSIERHLRFVAKVELTKIPLFGPALKRTGNVLVQRDGGERDRARLQEAVRPVRERVSIVFFAEGTRSPDGTLGPFKRGAATLAIAAGVPLLPAAVAGTKDILPKGTTLIHTGRKVALVIGRPISTAGKTPEDRDALTQEAREAVRGLLDEAQALVREAETS